jgi:bacteriocin-like protein
MKMNTTAYENGIELTIDELDAVTGGEGVVESIIEGVKTFVQIITGTTNVCTNHWYSA